MRKLLATLAIVTLVACGSPNTSATLAADSLHTDSTKIDSVKVDSVKLDTLK